MTSTKPSITRLLKLMERQSKAAFGADFQPANRVTPREAPRDSRPSTFACEKLAGREVQAQSKPERAAALLALYHPGVFDLHEQKVLFVEPRSHPLIGHPLAIGLSFPPLQGTVAVADRMGWLARHPVVRMASKTVGEYSWVPFPFVGDFLLFILDSRGPFCANWTVKKDDASFQFRMPGIKPRPLRGAPCTSEIERHEIEAIYYADGDIPTYRVTEEKIDKEVRINLLNLFYWHARSVRASPVATEQALTDFERGIGSGMPAFELVKQVMQDHQLDQDSAKAILKKGIWSRRLRVDLFSPILDDKPLRPETIDVLDTYGTWFQRCAS